LKKKNVERISPAAEEAACFGESSGWDVAEDERRRGKILTTWSAIDVAENDKSYRCPPMLFSKAVRGGICEVMKR